MNGFDDKALSEMLNLNDGALGRLHEANTVTGPERDPTVAPRP
jgi:hypothetical protein